MTGTGGCQYGTLLYTYMEYNMACWGVVGRNDSQASLKLPLEYQVLRYQSRALYVSRRMEIDTGNTARPLFQCSPAPANTICKNITQGVRARRGSMMVCWPWWNWSGPHRFQQCLSRSSRHPIRILAGLGFSFFLAGADNEWYNRGTHHKQDGSLTALADDL